MGKTRTYRCPQCRAEYDKPFVLCVQCGADMKTGLLHKPVIEAAPDLDPDDGDEDDDEAPYQPSTGRWVAAWMAEYLPGLFRPLVLIGAILIGAVGLAILFFGLILVIGFMVLLGGMTIVTVGALAYAQGVAWILDGEFSFLPDALTEFDETKWALWFVGLLLPGTALIVLVKYGGVMQ